MTAEERRQAWKTWLDDMFDWLAQVAAVACNAIYRPSSKAFCKKWAKLASRNYKFDVSYDSERQNHAWKVELYDLWAWDGHFMHQDGHDVRSGFGKTLREAWDDLANSILQHENAKSREEALVKAELESRRDLPRGWLKEIFDGHVQKSKMKTAVLLGSL